MVIPLSAILLIIFVFFMLFSGILMWGSKKGVFSIPAYFALLAVVGLLQIAFMFIGIIRLSPHVVLAILIRLEFFLYPVVAFLSLLWQSNHWHRIEQ